MMKAESAAAERTAVAPRPLRALVCCPSAVCFELEDRLRRQIADRSLRIVSATADELAARLKSPAYYHALVISVEAFTGLPDGQREMLARRVNLLILAPGSVDQTHAQEWLPLASGGVALQVDMEARTNAFVANLLGELVSGLSLFNSVARAWEAHRQEDTPPWVYFDRAEGAIWHQQKVHAGERPSYISTSPSSTPPAGVVIGTAIFGKYIHSEGDQIYIDRSSANSTSVTQSAGGDQVNINRISNQSNPEIKQDSDGDQANVNRFAGQASRACTQCGEKLTERARFCPNCGVSVG